MEKSKLKFNPGNLILAITSYPGYNNDCDSGEYLKLFKKIKTSNETKNEYKLGMTVYHKNVYNGKEPLEIVGIRNNELELRGDYSGMYNIIDNCWLPIEGVLLKKNND